MSATEIRNLGIVAWGDVRKAQKFAAAVLRWRYEHGIGVGGDGNN